MRPKPLSVGISAPAKVLALLCSMYFVNYIVRVNVSTAAAVFQPELHLSNTQVGLIFSAFAYPYLLFQIAGGWVADKFGGRVAVNGSVKLKGKPIKDGALVIFEPKDGQDTAGNATTTGGNYSLAREGGLKPGKYLIRVTAGDGATAINPYLSLELLQERLASGHYPGLDEHKAFLNYKKAIEAGLMKILAKKGISIISSYRGGYEFEANAVVRWSRSGDGMGLQFGLIGARETHAITELTKAP